MQTLDQLPEWPLRDPHSDKRDFGSVAILAGSAGMSGAAILCGTAALKGGAGLVTLFCPREIAAIVAAANPCYMVRGIEWAELDAWAADLNEFDAIVMGPGLTRHGAVKAGVPGVVASFANLLVLDADALNILADNGGTLPERSGATILTPHVREMSRLCRIDVAAVTADREAALANYLERLRQAAPKNDTVVVLKGDTTLVADGTRLYRNHTGNPGLATGGTGDVLAGLLGAIVCQGFAPLQAAALGVHLHGRAGDLAAVDIGEISLTAQDLLTYIPMALREHYPKRDPRTELHR